MSALKEILEYYGMPKENIESATEQIAETYGANRYLEGVANGAEAVKELGEQTKKPSFRIVCDINGDYRVEVLDKPINHWYIAASKMGQGLDGMERAAEYCVKHFNIDKEDKKNDRT